LADDNKDILFFFFWVDEGLADDRSRSRSEAEESSSDDKRIPLFCPMTKEGSIILFWGIVEGLPRDLPLTGAGAKPTKAAVMTRGDPFFVSDNDEANLLFFVWFAE